jgi:rhodanese-related sulfurtransferase
MNRNYIYLTILMLVLAAGTWLLKKPSEFKQIKPETLLWEIIQPTRYVSSDQVAKMIIQKDPSLEIIDVRSEEEYNMFSLPGAFNIPLDSLLSSSNLAYFGIQGVKVVFISNDDIKADQAWVITKRLGYKSTYVMKGGLNCWIETIIQPQEPNETAAEPDFELYSFRKGAQLFFTGAKVETASSDNKEKVVVKRKKKAAVAAGGC